MVCGPWSLRQRKQERDIRLTLGDRLALEGYMGAAGQEVMYLVGVPVAVVVVVVRGSR